MTVGDTLKKRGSSHGNYLTQALATQTIKDAMRSGVNWRTLAPFQRDALEMIAVKLGRILSGDPDEIDHWHDIAGYASLVETGLRK